MPGRLRSGGRFQAITSLRAFRRSAIIFSAGTCSPPSLSLRSLGPLAILLMNRFKQIDILQAIAVFLVLGRHLAPALPAQG